MPVNKATSATLRKTGIQYEIVPRATVDSIKGCEALALWLYLITRPQNWVIRKTDIKNRFDWGRDRYTKAMTELKSLGLVTVASVRGDKGQLQGNIIWINHQPTEVQVNGTSVKPDVRLNSTLKDTEIKTKDTKKKDVVGFESFWKDYPVNSDKQRAEKAWMKLSAKDKQLAHKELNNFESNLPDYQKPMQLHASTYLNNKRWEDIQVSNGKSMGAWE